MPDFLSEKWFAEMNDQLVSVNSPLSGDVTVVLHFDGARTDDQSSLTLTVTPERAHVSPGSSSEPDVQVHLNVADAEQMASGHTDSATLLRQGKLKVSGDVHRLIESIDALQQILRHRP